MWRGFFFLALIVLAPLAGLGCKGGGVTAESFSVDANSAPIRKDEGKALLSKFTKLQLEERKNLKRKFSSELDQFTKKQRADEKEWKKESAKRLVEFRHSHRGAGDQVRGQVKTETTKRDAFYKEQAEAKKKLRDEQENQRKSFQAFQDTNFEMFKAHIDKGLRPPETLWPAGTAPYHSEPK